MEKMVVIYWSGTVNTEEMAKAIGEGASENIEVKVLNVGDAKVKDVQEAKYVALGCPAMGAEVLDEEMESFVESLEAVNWSGKRLALFGSYDWGDGEWMRNWEEQMKGYGASLIADGLIVQLTPEQEDVEQCKKLAQQLVEA